ncbi:MAG: hypothetical protein HY340_04175 [Candidatus Kerfeldbacteria bacterium]|nr:hypothetical protein [Candidatus Kerfeldbacteria bacterium]
MGEQVLPVSIKIEQVSHGQAYRGEFEIAGVRFDYELWFFLPIPQMEKVDWGSFDRLLRHMRFALMRDGELIPLTSRECQFFFWLVYQLVKRFYYDVETCGAASSSLMAQALRMAIRNATAGGQPLVMTIVGDCPVSTADCTTLGSPKFGCVIPAA